MSEQAPSAPVLPAAVSPGDASVSHPRPPRWAALRPYGFVTPWLLAALLLCVGAVVFLFVVSMWKAPFVGPPQPAFSTENYNEVLTSPLYRSALLRTLGLSSIVLVVAMVLTVPAAFYTAKGIRSQWGQGLVLLALTLPFLLGPLIRLLGLIGLLGRQGAINAILQSVGIVDTPVDWLLYSNFAICLGLVYDNMGLLFFASWLAFRLVPDAEIRAARDLGAGAATAFWKVTAPRAAPGIVAGAILTFVPVAGAFLEPQLLGANGKFLASFVSQQFLSTANWPLGSALSVAYFVILIPVALAIVAVVYGGLRLIARHGLRA